MRRSSQGCAAEKHEASTPHWTTTASQHDRRLDGTPMAPRRAEHRVLLGIVGRLVRRVRVHRRGGHRSLTTQARRVSLMMRPAGLPLPLRVLAFARDQLVIALQERSVGMKQRVGRLPKRPIPQLLAVLNLVDRGAVVPGVRAKLRLALLSYLS